jgi:hypothetical protein
MESLREKGQEAERNENKRAAAASALFHRIVSLICHSAGDIFAFLG